MFIICIVVVQSMVQRWQYVTVRCVNKRIGIDDVRELFEHDDGAVEQLNKPKGGEVYMFEGKHPEDWRADGYR